MLIALLLGIVLLVAWLMVGRSRRSAVAQQSRPRSEVETWVEEALARELGDRTNLGRDALLGALRGDPDPEVVTAVEAAVKKIRVAYEKLPHQNGHFEVRAEITFEDGTSATGRATFAADKLPAGIHDEFLRTGASFVFRDWHFPWFGPDRGWQS